MELTHERIYEMAPFVKTLGIEFPVLTPESVRAELSARPELATLGEGCTAARS